MRTDPPSEVVVVPVLAETLARSLEAHGDYRILRRIRPMTRREQGFRRTGELVVCVLDVETTGLDYRTDKIVELAFQCVRIDEHGVIVQTGRPRSWLEDPGMPLPPEIVRVTGLTDRDVAGRAISDGEAYGFISGADVVLSHNAGFDRPFVEKRLDLAGQAWICSLRDIDWASHGFEGRSQGGLLMQCGWFYDAHRAEADVNALLHLLDHRLETGSVMKGLLANAARPTWIVEAAGAGLGARPLLKRRGYRWAPVKKVWWTELRDDSLAVEVGWMKDHVYGGQREPDVRPLTWRERYSASAAVF